MLAQRVASCIGHPWFIRLARRLIQKRRRTYGGGGPVGEEGGLLEYAHGLVHAPPHLGAEDRHVVGLAEHEHRAAVLASPRRVAVAVLLQHERVVAKAEAD